MIKIKKYLGLASALAAIPVAMAVPIEGHISFEGSTSLDAAVPEATEFISFSNVKVSTGTQEGTYLGTAGASVMMEAIQFVPFSMPAQPLWSFTVAGIEYSFDLLDLETVEVEALGDDLYGLNIAGTGVAHVDGYDDTPGAFSITTTGNSEATNLGFGAFTFTQAETSAVPDSGTTAALLGSCLLGAFMVKRRVSRVAA